MKLLIVESPAKCTTIKKYLGDNYVVMASLGHIRDLATSGKGGLGVDIENGFIPSYIINKDKVKVVKELQEVAKQCDEVILATDPDREGEAIAWHLANVLNLDPSNTKRLEFHEITRESITEAISNPRTINNNLVASQETRRILDRIIGFKLSTLIYKKIKSRSAGRVQSATLKMIADHDLEIEKFVPEEYYSINVKTKIKSKEISLTYVNKEGTAQTIKSKEQAEKVINNLPEKLDVVSVNKSFRTKEAKEPFTTSTMQQEAFAKLKFKTKKTQFIAQELYEGINVGGEHVGLITYMRTDSTRLSPVFVNRANDYISEKYGTEYLGKAKTKKAALMQDAHEAIRPTSLSRNPDAIRQYLSLDQYNLYKLIYYRTLSSLMAPKKEEVLQVISKGNDSYFKFDVVNTVFKGYQICVDEEKNESEYQMQLPQIYQGDSLDIIEKKYEQKFTEAPSYYSEAKVVKLMEEEGIGRPSTYSATIETLKARKYVDSKNGALISTEQGKKTAHVLEKYFPEIVNLKYTAAMEKKLDNVQDGNESRKTVLSKFYDSFKKEVESANVNMYKDEAVQTGETCPLCGAPLVIKEGKNGQFIGCSNYPTCKYVKKEKKQEAVQTGEFCPECGAPLVERTDKKGNKFIACSAYPKCKYIKPDSTVIAVDENTKKCPKCGSPLVKKKGKYGYFYGCSNFPKCNYMEKIFKKKRN